MERPLFTASMRPFVLALIFALASLSAHLAHARLEKDALGNEPILPDAATLRFLASSHRVSVADLYWLHLVQYIGTPASGPVALPHLEALAKIVTTLDPDFGFAYEAVGIALSEVGRVQSSNEILQEGMERVPERWQLPFFASFNHWHHLGEFEKGAALLLRAAGVPGSPRHLAELSSRLYASAGNVEEGLALVEMMLQAGGSEMMRQELERQREKLLVERALQRVEAAVRRFQQKEGRLPASLDELRFDGIQELLASEAAAGIRWDPVFGTVTSSLLPERLVLYRPPEDGVPPALARPQEVEP